MMVSRIGATSNKGEKMTMEDLKKVEGIEEDPQSMQDASPFEKLIPHLEVHTLGESLQ